VQYFTHRHTHGDELSETWVNTNTHTYTYRVTKRTYINTHRHTEV